MKLSDIEGVRQGCQEVLDGKGGTGLSIQIESHSSSGFNTSIF